MRRSLSMGALLAPVIATACHQKATIAEGLPEVASAGELLETLDGCDGCVRLLYVWSPSMPLSLLGVAEAAKAARQAGLPLILVRDSALETPGAGPSERTRRAVVATGAAEHYPSLVLARDQRPVAPAILGYKRAPGYSALVAGRLRDAAAPTATAEAPSRGPTTPRAAPGRWRTASRPDTAVEVVWRRPVDPPIGAFFRRIAGTRLLTFDRRDSTFFLDLETDEVVPGPGPIDLVPTPDGRLLVTPARNRRGLEFHVTAEAVRRGRSGEPHRPMHRDGEMVDQYPSTGILEASSDDTRTRYRVLLSWFEGLVFRDYDVVWDGPRAVSIEPASPVRRACPGTALSIPIMAEDGRELAARDEASATTKIFRLADDGSCDEVADLGLRTSKVDFSEDGELVAFSSREADGSASTWVLDRQVGTMLRIPDSSSRGLVIPEFVGRDSLLILSTPGGGPREFRMVCCVR